MTGPQHIKCCRPFFLFQGVQFSRPRGLYVKDILWHTAGGAFNDGRAEKGDCGPAGRRRGIYSDCKADGHSKGYGAQLLQEERDGRRSGRRAGRCGGAAAGRLLPGMRKSPAAAGGHEEKGVLFKRMPGEVVARASGENKTAGGLCLYLCRVRRAVYGLRQCKAEILLP